LEQVDSVIEDAALLAGKTRNDAVELGAIKLVRQGWIGSSR
jgi:hypothetical protein